jgi:hypothetical protein
MKATTWPGYLLGFYEAAVLPQFGITNVKIDWGERIRLGPDEFYCDFQINGKDYGLIFEDYQDLGQDPAYIEDELGLRKDQYEFVLPISATHISPSYAGFRMPTPYKYIEGVTGTFTLLRIYSEEERKSDEPKEVYQYKNGGMVSIDE